MTAGGEDSRATRGGEQSRATPIERAAGDR